MNDNEHSFEDHDEHIRKDQRITELEQQLAAAQQANGVMRAALKQITEVVDAHECFSYSCDRDGEMSCDCLECATRAAKDALSLTPSSPDLTTVREALEKADDALRYGQVGRDHPFNRLIRLIETERSKCRGDDWMYWNYLAEKLKAAQAFVSTALATLGGGK